MDFKSDMAPRLVLIVTPFIYERMEIFTLPGMLFRYVGVVLLCSTSAASARVFGDCLGLKARRLDRHLILHAQDCDATLLI
jgi:hypothetical protein